MRVVSLYSHYPQNRDQSQGFFYLFFDEFLSAAILKAYGLADKFFFVCGSSAFLAHALGIVHDRFIVFEILLEMIFFPSA